MMNKTVLSRSVSLLMLTLSQAAIAIPTTIMDTYIGGDDHGYGDVISGDGDATFGIESMDIEMTGNMLSVSIQTSFAGRGDDGLFSRYTDGGKGIGYGDLFLSDSWTPSGAAPYLNDDNTNGTVWTYGFTLKDRWMSENSKGSGALVKLNSGNNNADALLSDDLMTGATYRNGQEVAVDLQNGDISFINNGSWDIASGRINFLIDLTGTTLASSKTIALHWGMTCGNDVIEGEYTRDVPTPGILSLLLAGLAGLALTRRFRNSA